jgi:hypothetical protein
MNINLSLDDIIKQRKVEVRKGRKNNFQGKKNSRWEKNKNYEEKNDYEVKKKRIILILLEMG